MFNGNNNDTNDNNTNNSNNNLLLYNENKNLEQVPMGPPASLKLIKVEEEVTIKRNRKRKRRKGNYY